MKDILMRSGIEITHSAAISGEYKKGNITTPQTSNSNKFTTLETTTTVYNALRTVTTTATVTTTTAISDPTIPINTTNAETITNIEGNNYFNDTVTVTTAITTTDTILIRDGQLQHRKILQPFEDETSLWWIHLQKLLEKDKHTYHSITETFDNSSKISNLPTFISDVNSGNKLLEKIVHELRENPSKYKVSVEHTDDRQSWIVIRIGNYRKLENLHEAKFMDIPAMVHQFPVKHDSPEELKANYHIIRIKLPYEFLNNATSDKGEIQQKQPYTSSQNISGIDEQRLKNQEEELIFEKLPGKYIENQHGYLYRVQIHDINRELPFTRKITADHEMREREIESSKTTRIENKDDHTTGREISTTTNSSCFGMVNRQLLYNASYKTIYDVSFERCRCACANTWLEEDCVMMKCKSFQYSNITRKCLLNEDDHNGKFDLVYNWDTNYFYRICIDEDIVKDALRNCPMNGKIKPEQIASKKTIANWDTTINKTIHSTKKRSTIDNQSPFLSSTFGTQSVYRWKKSGKEEVSNKTITEEVILSPNLWSKILKIKNAGRNLRSLVFEIRKKESEEISDGIGGYKYRIEIRHGTTTTATATTSIPYDNRAIRSTKDSGLEAIRKRFGATAIFTDYITKTTTIEPSSYEEVKSPIKKPEVKVVEKGKHDEIRTINGNDKKFEESVSGLNSSSTNLTSNNQRMATTKKEVGETEGFDSTSHDYNENYGLNETDITTISVTVTEGSGEMTTEEKFEIPEIDFEGVDYSHKFKTEQNSTSKAPENCFEVIDGFILKDTAGGLEQEVTLEECQCYCANSRSNERYSFQCLSATYYHKERDCVLNLQTRNEFPEQFKRQDNVSYLGMICSVEDSKQQLVDINLIDGCRRIVNITTSTAESEKVFEPVNTDNCFVEMPNHVLYGTAFAAEIDVSVEACKCYCMIAEKQYGIECRSIEYYFDSRTCLLNNLSRETNPKNFNYSIVSTLMHSYFDKSCSNQNNEFSIYINEKCLNVIKLLPVNMNLSLNLLNEIGTNRNNILHPDEVTNTYDSDSGNDFIDSHVTLAVNPIHSTEYATHLTYHDLSKEMREEKDKEDILRDHDLMTKYTTTVISADENYTNFMTVNNSSSKLNNTVANRVTTTPMKMDYAINNQTLKTTPPAEITTYPHLQKCVYSAIYRTSFRGIKLIKRVLISSPQQCFYGCHFEGCRSSNLIQVDNQTYSCELFSDALIDYRTPDVLVYDRGSVYFDGIKCNAK
ncbi:unnamed protein product [Cercopithifilaria johnstoni]|uniref:Apple domain-containing protein n=1 Tax=Cercopithifilaria johnstoni TaxID=2874296 RepID=A0A8J2MK10_9BILA|nr:unnamed protein product [Cercopithifilaria johnstoni]